MKWKFSYQSVFSWIFTLFSAKFSVFFHISSTALVKLFYDKIFELFAPRLKKCSIKKLFLKISQNSQQVCVFVWIYEFFRTPFLYNFSGGCLCVCILRTIQAILVSLLIKLNFLERVSRRTSNKFGFSRNKPFPSFISCTVLCCMSYL